MNFIFESVVEKIKTQTIRCRFNQMYYKALESSLRQSITVSDTFCWLKRLLFCRNQNYSCKDTEEPLEIIISHRFLVNEPWCLP